MSKMFKRPLQTDASFLRAADAIQAIVVSHGKAYSNADLAKSAIGFMGLEEIGQTKVSASLGDLVSMLKNDVDVTAYLDSAIGEIAGDKSGKLRDLKMQAALEHAAYSILQAGAPTEAYQAAIVNAKAPAQFNGTMVHPADGTKAYGLESFEPVDAHKWVGVSALINAASVVSGEFEDNWFPTTVVPAGESGVDVDITIPYVFNSQARDTNGAPLQQNRRRLVDAVTDPSFLEDNSTTIYPYASSATLPAVLVPAAQIPSVDMLVAGVTVPTRPIKFGETVGDIIGLSNAPGLLKTGVFDDTDQLDPVMNIGKVFYRLNLSTGTGGTLVTSEAYASVDISNQIGSLLVQSQQGALQEYQTTGVFKINITNTFTSLNGTDSAAVRTHLATILGNADPFTIEASVQLSALGRVDTAEFGVNQNNARITALYDATGNKVATSPLTASNVIVTVTPIGYLPALRRTNSNLRQLGLLVDLNTTKRFRFPVSLQSPIALRTPVGGSNMVTVEGLANTARLRQTGRAVSALLNLRDWLKSTNGIPTQHSVLGAELVKPTYVPQTIDVSTMVSTISSKDNLDNLRGQFVAAISQIASMLARQSGYLAALEYTTGNISGYEILVLTDPQLRSYLMTEGDMRTFGDGRSYVISSSNHVAFKNKFFISFRRSQRSDDLCGLDFGKTLVTPPITAELPISRDGRTTNELQMIPRVNNYVTLPVLGELVVTGMDAMYVQ